MKDARGSNNTGAAGSVEAAATRCYRREEQRWVREVLRRGVLELLYLVSNLVIAADGLFWLYRLLTHKPALQAGLSIAAAVGLSLFAYHFARWRASAAISRQVEKLMAWLIVAVGMGLVWGAICFAFTYGALRWFSVAGATSSIIGAVAGLCGFAYMVAGEWSELGDCLAFPAAANQDRRSDESTA